MKTIKIISIFVLVMISASLFSQHGVLKQQVPSRPQVKTISEADYKAHADGWLVDMEEAYKVSKKTGKPIMANFTGSDWCGWCKKLKYEVFDKDEFKAWAKKNVVLVELDFPRRFKIPQKYQDQNHALAKGFGVRGYPTIWVFNLDKDDKGQMSIAKLGTTPYQKGISLFTQTIEKIIAQSTEK